MFKQYLMYAVMMVSVSFGAVALEKPTIEGASPDWEVLHVNGATLIPAIMHNLRSPLSPEAVTFITKEPALINQEYITMPANAKGFTEAKSEVGWQINVATTF